MSEQNAQRVWFITGASSGFGRELGTQVLKKGDRAVVTARKPEQIADFQTNYPETALVLALDVTRRESVDAAVAAALNKFGRVDVLVNNAGYGLTGAIEEATEDEFMPVFETNVFGLLRVTQALLPQFRKQRSGHILNLSSIGGLIGSPGMGYYNATKFAVNGLSEALAGEMEPLGVKVTVIEPGPFRTDFLGRSGVQAARQIPEYTTSAGKMREYFAQNDGKQAGDPAKAAEAMIAVVESETPPRHLLLGKAAFDRMTARVDLWKKDLAAWQETTLGADYPEGK